MQTINLTELVSGQLDRARSATHGRSAQTIHGDRERRLRQVVMALARGYRLDAHDSPPEATLQVLTGEVQLSTGFDTWQGSAGDFLVIPDERHDVLAVQDCAFILTVVTNR